MQDFDEQETRSIFYLTYLTSNKNCVKSFTNFRAKYFYKSYIFCHFGYN